MMAETREKRSFDLLNYYIDLTALIATHPSNFKGVTNDINKDIKNTSKILEFLL
jgi:hypothetical protein